MVVLHPIPSLVLLILPSHSLIIPTPPSCSDPLVRLISRPLFSFIHKNNLHVVHGQDTQSNIIMRF